MWEIGLEKVVVVKVVVRKVEFELVEIVIVGIVGIVGIGLVFGKCLVVESIFVGIGVEK